MKSVKKTIVVARYNENVDWVKPFNHFIVQKCEHLPNIGREPTSYLWYIVENYDNLEGRYFFSQGNPFTHRKDFLTDVKNAKQDFEWYSDLVDLKCKNNGYPHDSELDINKLLRTVQLKEQNWFEFKAGCLFSVTAEVIKRRPKEFYQKLGTAICEQHKAPWAFERIIDLVFKSSP